jgi:hypothetical protein
MPRYFFNIQDGADFPDKEGTELPDMKAVRTRGHPRERRDAARQRKLLGRHRVAHERCR